MKLLLIRFHQLLIRLVVGKHPVIMNCYFVNGAAVFKEDNWGIAINNVVKTDAIVRSCSLLPVRIDLDTHLYPVSDTVSLKSRKVGA